MELEIRLPVYDEAAVEAVVAEKGLSERHWPYWLEDWSAALGLIETLEGGVAKGADGPVLDLGCGSGLLSHYLAPRFSQVMAFDRNEEACRLTRLNSGLPVCCADFTHNPFNRKFGLVLAGDLLYEKPLIPQVLEFLGESLSPRGLALLADPGRSTVTDFPESAVQAGFSVRGISFPGSQSAGRNIFILARPGRELPFPSSE